MAIHAGTTVTAFVAAAALGLSHAAPAGATTGCAPAAPGQTRILLERVPHLMSARMAATRDGGVVVAFASYRGSAEFPGANVTVLALDRSGCQRWRASLRGRWAIAQPVEAGSSIVVASAGPDGALHVYTLSAATGRVRHRDVFALLVNATGYAPTLLTDRLGDVAIVLAAVEPSRSPRRTAPVTLKLSRRVHAARWTRQELARSGVQPPAAAARADGEIVVGYPRKGRFWVRTGTVAGRLGRPVGTGLVAGNFKPGAVALGEDGATAAVWQSGTYSRAWRLRAAVRPAGAERFERFAQLGLGKGFTETPPSVRVGAGGRVMTAFVTPSGGAGGQRIMCATATPDGRFGRTRQLAAGGLPDAFDQAPMLFGRGGSASVLVSTLIGGPPAHMLVKVDAGCRALDAAALQPGAGAPQGAAIDVQGRTWVLGQDLDRAGVSARRALLLTIEG